jgi:hypothetical protein
MTSSIKTSGLALSPEGTLFIETCDATAGLVPPVILSLFEKGRDKRDGCFYIHIHKKTVYFLRISIKYVSLN